MNTNDEKIQWHPAFDAALQIELGEETKYLEGFYVRSHGYVKSLKKKLRNGIMKIQNAIPCRRFAKVSFKK